MTRYFIALFATPSLVLAATFAGVEVPAPLPPREVVEKHWGVEVVDPYRYLENTTDPEIQKHMRAQADAAAAILAKLPGRAKLLARVKEIDADTPAVVNSVTRDERGRYFYLKREARDNQFKLYKRDTPEGAETLLVDPEEIGRATGKPNAINSYSASPDGRLVAYSISASGAEIGKLHVIDTATRKEVTPAIERIRSDTASWLQDASGFFYNQLKEGYESLPRAERFVDHRSFFRRLSDPTKDFVVFGPGVHADVPLDRAASADVFVVPGHRLVAAFVAHGVERNRSFYLADLEEALAGKPRWRKVFDQAARVEDAAIGGDFLYVKTALDAPRYKVLRMRLLAPELRTAGTVFAAGEEVVADIGAARDALYVTRREGAIKRLWRVPHAANAQPKQVAMPFEGNVRLTHVDARMDGAVLQLGTWTRTAQHHILGARDSAPALLPLAPLGKYAAPPGITSREVRVRSHDGVEVPMSIIARADVKLDGSNPAILNGYGAYGITDEPGWSPRLLAWLEQGGVFAIAHVRGGGIYGDEWHRAGWQTTKPNTWKDGIAAAEWLIANGFTRRDRLAVSGGSAGGIFVGRAITERPDLFAAAVVSVGNTDSIRSETRANGVANIPEYGTVTKEDQFRALLAMSPYANVKPRTPYPAVMFEHGVNDIRVDVWMTLKTGSRLAAASTSGKPVLMRLEYEEGHGAGMTREQILRLLADRWSFLLWQFGVPEFQPADPGTPSPAKTAGG